MARESPSRMPSLSRAFNSFRSKDKDPAPPPLPPKDFPYTDSLSIPPMSPVSPYNFSQFQPMHTPGPSQSTLSLVSTSAASSRSQAQDNRHSRLKAKASSLFTFVKRSSARSIKSPDPEREFPTSSDDPGISTPWNFQHNIHVDEAFIGLPPSWSTQLAQQGLSPEEIEALHARRMNIVSGRLTSPNLRIHTAPPTMVTPVLGASSPGAEEQHRQYSYESSPRSSSHDHGNPLSPPPISHMVTRSLTSSPSAASLRSTVTTTTKSSHALPASLNGHQPSFSTPHASRSEPIMTDLHDQSPHASADEHDDDRPSTPPLRRPFHVVNPTLSSPPPPAYSQYTQDKKDEKKDETAPSTDSITAPSNRRSIIRNKRNSILPPRLSLHKTSESLDLMSWSAELLSGISSSGNSSYGAAADRSKNLPSSSKSEPVRSPLSQMSVVPTHRRQGSKNPPPPIHLQDADDNLPPPPTGWAEPASALRTSPLDSAFDGLIDPEAEYKSPSTFSPAFEDGCSPILPTSPSTPGWRPRGSSLSPQRGDDPDESFLHVEDGREAVRYSKRSSSSTVSTISASTVVGYPERALVKSASVIRKTSAYVIDRSGKKSPLSPIKAPPSSSSSPLSSHFGSEEGSSVSSGSPSQDRHPTPTEMDSPFHYFGPPSRLPFGTKAPVHLLVSTSGTFGGVREEDGEEEEEEEEEEKVGVEMGPMSESEVQEFVVRVAAPSPQEEVQQRPKIVISPTDMPSISTLTPGGITPLTPVPRYPGWLSAVVMPLEDFIDEAVDPREYYIDLQEIAEGESGSVFAAQLAPDKDLTKLRMDTALVVQDQHTLATGEPVAVAIKSVSIVPSGSPKLDELGRELTLMKGLHHENILSMDALYVDLVEDALWIRMELMERSLADVVSLVEGGLQLHDRMIARFASDALQALQFLQTHHIAHRDVRSDNLLLNIQGVVKLADFSTAVQVSPEEALLDDIVGVPYWQAPEVRSPPYNVLQVDVWSLGATVWELAEAEPPFASTNQLADRFPPLSNPKLFSPAFHDFLHQCSDPPDSRPDPATLGAHPFMKNACGRTVIIQLLAQCMNIEKQQYQPVEEN